MERRGLSGRCVTRTEIVQTYPSVQGRMEKIERKGGKKGKRRKRDDDIVCYPVVEKGEKGCWKIGVVDEAWRDNDDSAFVTKVEERGDVRVVFGNDVFGAISRYRIADIFFVINFVFRCWRKHCAWKYDRYRELKIGSWLYIDLKTEINRIEFNLQIKFLINSWD